tara:strand:- start:935 stop:2077 length:1143 start_codon:yes stop_codon:yes gene_type:complete
MMEDKVSIIIPTFNEAENICDIIKSIKNNLSEINVEIIVVDDDSPDGTGAIVEDYIHSITENHRHSISIIHRKTRKGLSAAILNGVEKSNGRIVVVMDSDFSHPPDVIPKMLDKIEETQCDVVIASRYVQGGNIEGWPIKRKLISKAATEIAKKGLGVEANDPMSGFFAFKKNLIKDISFDAIGYKVLLELLVKSSDVNIQEIPYTFTDRKFGTSKLGSSTILDYCKSVWKLYRYGKDAAKKEKRASVKFLSKAARFFTVGASGLGVNYLSSILFTTSFDLWYIHSTIIGILFAITSNFFLHKYWTFGDRNFSLKRTIFQYTKFAGFSSISGLVQIGMVFYFVNEFNLSYPVSLVLAVGTAAFSNFIVNKKWTFNEKVWG